MSFEQAIRSNESDINEMMSRPNVHAVRRRIRVKKQDSAYVYFILESQEGITAYSTIEYKPGDTERMIELFIPPKFCQAVEDLLRQLKIELGDRIHEV